MENSKLLSNQVLNNSKIKIHEFLTWIYFFIESDIANIEVPTDILANFGDDEIEDTDGDDER